MSEVRRIARKYSKGIAGLLGSIAAIAAVHNVDLSTTVEYVAAVLGITATVVASPANR